MLPTRLVVAAVCGLIWQGVAFADSTNPVQGSDAEITDRVAHMLQQADADVARRISVSTLNGVVTLDGTVYTASQVLKVLRDASRVTGVVQVKNRLHAQL